MWISKYKLRIFSKLKFVLILVIFVNGYGQNNDRIDSIKHVINQLYSENNIAEINTLINRSTFLPPEYSIELINNNIEISAKQNDKKNLGYSYLTLGNFWSLQGNKTQAYENYVKSETVSREANDQKRLGMAILGQANMLNDKLLKINRYHDAVEIMKEQKDSVNLMKAYLNIGYDYTLLYMDSNIPETEKNEEYRQQANYFFKQIDILNNHIQHKEINAILKYRKSEWEIYDHHYQIAKQLLNDALNIFSELNMTQWKVFCMISLSNLEELTGNDQHSIEKLQTAETLSKQHKFYEQLLYVYETLRNKYEHSGDIDKAYQYAKLHDELAIKQAEINSQDKIKALELEQKVSENQRLLENYKNKQFIYLIIIGFIIFILILGSVLFYTINKSNKRKISNIEKDKIITEIELQNQHLQEELLKEKIKFNQEHLMVFANQVSQIDSFLENLKNQIKKLPLSEETKETITDLKLSFNELMGNQNQLRQINSLNSEINQEFFLRIQKQFPGLTKSETQLLSFLIRDMSSKEIADLLKITPESVNKKRYRLRKKLEMNNEKTFLDFYNKVITSQT